MKIYIDIPKLNDCLERLGWSRTKLAAQSDICTKTVSRLYKEGQASDKTHAAILRAIQLEFEDRNAPNIPVSLKLDDASEPPVGRGLAVDTLTIEITLTLPAIRLEDLNTETFDKLQEKIRAVIGRAPRPRGFEEGSTKVRYLLSREEFDRLRQAFDDGVFGDSVSRIEVSRQVGRHGVVNPESDISREPPSDRRRRIQEALDQVSGRTPAEGGNVAVSFRIQVFGHAGHQEFATSSPEYVFVPETFSAGIDLPLPGANNKRFFRMETSFAANRDRSVWLRFYDAANNHTNWEYRFRAGHASSNFWSWATSPRFAFREFIIPWNRQTCLQMKTDDPTGARLGCVWLVVEDVHGSA